MRDGCGSAVLGQAIAGTSDEMVVRIAGKRMYLWRAVEHEGEILNLQRHLVFFPGQRFGPSDRKPRRIGAAPPLRHNLPEGVHYLRPEGLKLTMPSGPMAPRVGSTAEGPLLAHYQS